MHGRDSKNLNDILDFGTKTYRYSNPEYLVYIPGKFMSFEEYRIKVLPIINSSFPELKPGLYQSELDENEALYIQKQLSKENFNSMVIPKSLYDLFYMYFRYKELIEHHTPYLKNFNASVAAIHVDPITRLLAKSNSDVLTDPDKRQEFVKFLESEKLTMQFPVLRISDTGIYEDYQNRVNDILHQKLEFELNNRILRYLKDIKIDVTQPLKITALPKIIDDIFNKFYQIYNPNLSSHLPQEVTSFEEIFLEFPSRRENFKIIIFDVILHEFCLDPRYYTLYRTKENKGASLFESISFSQSVPGSGILYDNYKGSAAGIKARESQKKLFSLNVMKSEYHLQGSITNSIIFIPPALRTTRTAGTGEFFHARLKFSFNVEEVMGLYKSKFFLAKFVDRPHLLKINEKLIKNEKDYKTIVIPFLEQNLQELTFFESHPFFAEAIKKVIDYRYLECMKTLLENKAILDLEITALEWIKTVKNKQAGANNIEYLSKLLKEENELQYKNLLLRAVIFEAQYLIFVHHENAVKKIHHSLRSSSMMPSDSFKQLSFSAVSISNKINTFITTKSLNFLSNNKYKLLFLVALISYGLYDHHHKKKIIQAVSVIKNSLFSAFRPSSTSSIEQDARSKEKELDKGSYLFTGL